MVELIPSLPVQRPPEPETTPAPTAPKDDDSGYRPPSLLTPEPVEQAPPLSTAAAPDLTSPMPQPERQQPENIFNSPQAQIDLATRQIDALRSLEPTDPQLKVISENTGIPTSVLKKAPPHLISAHLERQDVKAALEQAVETRSRIIADAEAALVLRGELPAMAASEQALARLGLQVRAPYAQPILLEEQEDGEEPVSFGQGMLNAMGRGVLYGQSAGNLAISMAEAQAALDLQNSFTGILTDVFQSQFREGGMQVLGVDVETTPVMDAMYWINAMSGVLWEGTSRLASRFLNDPGDAAELAQSAAERMALALDQYRSGAKIPMSDAGKGFAAQLDDIPESYGPVESAWAILKAMANDKAGATAFFAEVMGEQTPVFAAQFGASALTRRPIIGVGVGVMGTYSQEAYRAPVEMLRDDFDIDIMRDPDAAQKLISNPEALKAVEQFGQARGAPIALAQLLSLGVASRVSRAGRATGASRTREVLGTAASQFVIDYLGEAAAMYGSTGEVSWTEAFIEGIAGTVVDTPIDIATTSTDVIQTRRDEAKLRQFLETGKEISGNLRNMDPVALNKAAEILGDKMKREGIERVYIDADALNKFNQDNPDMDVARTLGLDKDALAEATDEGADIEIDARTFMRHILGREGFDALIEHTRLDPDGPKAGDVDNLDADIEASIEEQLQAAERKLTAAGMDPETLVKLQDDVAQIQQDVADQLRSTGRFTEGQLQALAETTAKRYAARAVRARTEGADTDALTLYLEDNVRIQGENPDIGRAFEQGEPGQFNPELAAAFEGLPEYNPDDILYDPDLSENAFWISPDGRIVTAEGDRAMGVHANLVRDRVPGFGRPGEGADALADRFQSESGGIRFVIESDDTGPRNLFVKSHDKQLSDGQRQALRRLASSIRRDRPDNEGRIIIERLNEDEVVMSEELPLAAAEADIRAARQGEAQIFYQSTPTPATTSTHPTSLDDAVSYETWFERLKSERIPNNRALKVLLQAALKEQAEAAGVDPSDGSEETIKYLTRIGVTDALYALQGNQNAVGWYDEKVTEALEVLSLIHPELKTDPEAKLRFIWALAVTSNGLKVDKNFEWAERVYEESKRTGNRFRTVVSAGQASKAINDGLSMYNELVDEFGVEDLTKFVTSQFEAGVINRVSGYPAQGENADTVVRGAAILGPKIGNGFFSNLFGYFDALTMDRWLMRTWGRWTGTLIEINETMLAEKEKQSIEQLNILLSNPDVVSQIEDIATRRDKEPKPRTLKDGTVKYPEPPARKSIPATEITADNVAEVADWLNRNIFVKKAKREDFNKIEGVDQDGNFIEATNSRGKKVTWAEQVRLTLNAYIKYADGQVEQPRGGDERNLIREVFGRILGELRTTHGLKDLTMSDLQALVWYPEKRLYDAAKSSEEAEESYDDDEAPDYANAAAKLAKRKKISDAQIRSAQQRARRGAGGSQSGGGTSVSQTRPAGLEGSARKRFLATRAIHALRSDRRGDGAASGPYTRGSGGRGKSVRVLNQPSIASYKVSDRKVANNLNALGISTPTFLEVGPEAAGLFRERISQSKEANKYGASVYVYEEAEYAGMRMFMTADGTAGFALKGQDIVSVFSDGKSNPGAVHAMIELAIQEGGRTLDAFDTVLPELYAMHGFVVQSRLKWDEKEAPDTWDKQVFQKYNNGEPDVVFMALDVDSYDSVQHHPNVYFTDYNEAVANQLAKINAPQPQRQGPAFRQDVVGPRRDLNNLEFREWFGDSKVVDDNGDPLVVYHGTRTDTDFDEFRPLSHFGTSTAARDRLLNTSWVSGERIGEALGIPPAKIGDWWGGLSQSERDRLSDEYRGRFRSRVMPVYLSIKNPLRIVDDGSSGSASETAFQAWEAGAISRQEADQVVLKEQLIALLESKGYDGLVYTNMVEDEGSTSYVAFRPEQVKSVNNQGTFNRNDPNILRQGARGGFTPADMITDQNGNPVNLIEIFEKGDVSTFLHESGHFWLEQLKDDAGRFGGGFQKDWDTVINWWADNADAIRAEALDRARRDGDKTAVKQISEMSDSMLVAFIRSGNLRGSGYQRYLSVAMHEQFARGTEDYFRKGEAPSVDLVDAFNHFAAWLTSIYRSIQRRIGRDALDVQFSPEVKQVLDRMLATDTQIEIVAGQYDLATLFDTAEQAGMSPEQFKEHTNRIGRAKGRAKQRLVAKHMREIERVRLDWWREEREAMRAGVEEEIAQQSGMRLVWSLAQGGLANGATSRPSDRIDRISKQALIDLIGKERVEALPRAAGKVIYDSKKGEGIAPEFAAHVFGYPDVDAMVRDLEALPDFKDAVEAELDRRMEERHGLLEDDLAAEAVTAVHGGDGMGRILAAELAALRTTEQAIDTKFVKAYARKKLGKVKIADIRPDKYLAAERRHAKAAGKAVRQGNRKDAYKEQFQRLVNHYMAKEAQRRQSRFAKDRDYLSNFKRPRKKFPGIDAKYVDRIKQELDLIDFGPRMSDRKRLRLEMAAINDWILRRAEEDGAVLEAPAILQQADRTTNWRDMTLDEFESTVDWVKQLEQQGRLLKKLRFGKERRDRQEVLAQLRERLTAMPTARAVRARNKVASADEMGYIGKGIHTITGLDAALLKAEFLLEELDGEPIGPWHQAIFQPIADAAARKGDLMRQVSEMIQQRLDALPKDVKRSLGKKVDVGALGKPGLKMTRGNLIMLALNTGNESNLDKLIRGYTDVGWNINEDLVKAAVSQLSKEEWDLIQAIWDHAEKLWPEVEAIYRNENGRSPERIEPIATELDHGTYRGGYFPMFYDSSYGGRAEAIETADALEMFQAQHNRAGVNSSMTKERSSQFAAPVNLSIQLLPQAFDRTIHFITHYDAVRDIRRIMSDPALSQAFDQTVGPEYKKLLQTWLGAVASNLMDQPLTSRAQQAVDVLSRNTTAAILGFSYTTLTAQMLGLTVAIDRLAADTTYGPIGLARATADVINGLQIWMSPSKRKTVTDLSGEMRNRFGQQDRDLRRMLRQSRGKNGVADRARNLAGMLIAGLQYYMVDMPVWLASYNRSMRATRGNTAEAVAYADRVVRISQSGGDVKDLAAVQRDKGAMRAFTLFYSFFSVMYGVTRGVAGEVNKNPLTWLRAATRILILYTMQEIMMELIRGKELPDLEPEDEDEQGLISFAATRTLVGMAGTLPIARDIAAGAISPFGYSPTPISAFGEAAVRAVIKAAEMMGEEDPELDLNDLKPLVTLGSITFGVPGAIQVNRTLDGLQAYLDEEDGWTLMDFLNGYDEAQAEE